MRRLGHQRGVEPPGQRRMAAEVACGRLQRRGRVRQQRADPPRLPQPVAQRAQVARPAAAERQPRQRAVEVGHLPQCLAQVAAQVAPGQKMGDRVVAIADHAEVAGRACQPPLQEARAPGGHGAVDAGEKRAVAPAGKAADDLETAPGRGVDLHRATRRLAQGRPEERHRPGLGQVEIVDERAQRRDLAARRAAPGVGRLHPEQRQQAALPGLAVEARARPLGHRRAAFGRDAAQGGVGRLGHQHLAWGEPRQIGAEPRGSRGHHPELAGRDVGPGQRHLAADLRHRGEKVRPPCLEQRVLGQRPRRDQADHLAPHHRLRAALSGLGRVLDLLADRDAEALADQRQQIAFRGMDGHAAHRDVLAQMLAALGQRDVERGRGRHGILEEQLVEIAHPVEQERALMRILDLGKLRHHRRHRGAGIGHWGSPELSAQVTRATPRRKPQSRRYDPRVHLARNIPGGRPQDGGGSAPSGLRSAGTARRSPIARGSGRRGRSPRGRTCRPMPWISARAGSARGRTSCSSPDGTPRPG